MKTALITGASRGLGQALAQALNQDSWQLILNARGAKALQLVADGLEKATAVSGSVTDPAHRQQLAQLAQQAGGLDVVINNAGALGPSPQPHLLDYPLDTLADVYQTNVIAPLAILQAVRPYLNANAVIINISSDAAVQAYEGWGGYGSSKAALEQVTAVLAQENPQYHIYTVDPGDMRTQMHQEAFPNEDISDRPLPEASVPSILELIYQKPDGLRHVAQQYAPPDLTI